MNKNIVMHKKDDKLKAAYALNLCTVSISQIIELCEVFAVNPDELLLKS